MTTWLRRLGQLFVPTRPTLRVPQVGDSLWWAPKLEPCVVTEAKGDGSFIFQSSPRYGQLVIRPSGKSAPRWSATGVAELAHWDPVTELWIYGEGPRPKIAHGQLVFPQPQGEPEKFPEGVQVLRPDPVNAATGTQPGRIV